jgi:D-serine deaminase-like pyridoxal phosphate-dependent protein
MALDTARLATELDSIIADLPATVTFGLSTFSAAVTQGTVGSDIAEGGFLPSRDIGLHVKSTTDTRAVKVGSKLTVLSAGVTKTYRVISIERAQDGQELIFSCQSPSR